MVSVSPQPCVFVGRQGGWASHSEFSDPSKIYFLPITVSWPDGDIDYNLTAPVDISKLDGDKLWVTLSDPGRTGKASLFVEPNSDRADTTVNALLGIVQPYEIFLGEDSFGPSGENHCAGMVPDPGDVADNTHYLCEDGTWSVPAGSGGGVVLQQETILSSSDLQALDTTAITVVTANADPNTVIQCLAVTLYYAPATTGYNGSVNLLIGTSTQIPATPLFTQTSTGFLESGSVFAYVQRVPVAVGPAAIAGLSGEDIKIKASASLGTGDGKVKVIVTYAFVDIGFPA